MTEHYVNLTGDDASCSCGKWSYNGPEAKKESYAHIGGVLKDVELLCICEKGLLNKSNSKCLLHRGYPDMAIGIIEAWTL